MVREVSESCVDSLLTEMVACYCNRFYANKPDLAARRIEAIGYQNAEHNMATAELKHEEFMELKPELSTMKDIEELKPEKEAELKVSKDVELNTVTDVEELRPVKEAELEVSKGKEELKLMEAIEEVKSKLDEPDSKLNEAGGTISKLTEERRLSNQESKMLQEKLADLICGSPRKVHISVWWSLSVSSLDTVYTLNTWGIVCMRLLAFLDWLKFVNSRSLGINPFSI